MLIVMYKNVGQASILAIWPIIRARVVTEWFDDHDNDVNHVMTVLVTRCQPN
jgi:hypothetical protein